MRTRSINRRRVGCMRAGTAGADGVIMQLGGRDVRISLYYSPCEKDVGAFLGRGCALCRNRLASEGTPEVPKFFYSHSLASTPKPTAASRLPRDKDPTFTSTLLRVTPPSATTASLQWDRLPNARCCLSSSLSSYPSPFHWTKSPSRGSSLAT